MVSPMRELALILFSRTVLQRCRYNYLRYFYIWHAIFHVYVNNLLCTEARDLYDVSFSNIVIFKVKVKTKRTCTTYNCTCLYTSFVLRQCNVNG